MKNKVAAATDSVRKRLRERKGYWREIHEACVRANRKTEITYRWINAFAERKDREPKFSKVVELGLLLGVWIGIEVDTTVGETWFVPSRSRR